MSCCHYLKERGGNKEGVGWGVSGEGVGGVEGDQGSTTKFENA